MNKNVEESNVDNDKASILEEQTMQDSSDSTTSMANRSHARAPPLVRQSTINYNRTPVDADVVKLPVPEGERPINVEDDSSILGVSAYSILRYMYGALIAYSLLISYVTGCSWYTMLLFYLVEYLAFYLWHWQAHNRVWWIPFNEACHKKHKEHHWETYPPKDFYGTRKHKIGQEKGSTSKAESLPISTWDYMVHGSWLTAHEGLLFLLTFLQLIAARLVFHCSYTTIGGAFFGFMIMGFIGNWLHHAYHVEDYWLERYKWFHELRALHYIHHLGTAKHNYGVLNMTLDRFLGSLTFTGTKTKTNKTS